MMPMGMSPPSNDPYKLPTQYQVANWPVMIDRSRKTPVSTAIVGGQKTIPIVGFGQSLIGTHDEVPFTPTGLVDNFDINSGGMYSAADPMLGTTFGNVMNGGGTASGCWLLRYGDKIRANGWCARPILIPAGIAATRIADWAVGGFANRTITVTGLRLAAAGLLSATEAVFLEQGSGDTDDGTLQAAYAASLASFIATVRAAGFTCPIFIGVSSYNGTTTSANVTNAQIAAVDHGAGIWAGANSDGLTGGTNCYSGPHYNATGSNANADLWVTATGLYGAPFA